MSPILPLALESSLDALQSEGLDTWSARLRQELPPLFAPGRNGNLPRWLEALEQLPPLRGSVPDLAAPRVRVGQEGGCSGEEQAVVEQALRRLHPWRKGPFELFGVHIDTEWRSDWKWSRLERQIEPLEGRMVLDVGCGNGYHALRMAGAGARFVVGIDPNLLFLCQFRAVTRFMDPLPPVHLMPVAMESVPPNLQSFDTVFSMGVLYHRRSPMDHLLELRGALRPGGQLVLETLVIEGERGEVLVPEGRYAKMRNTWFIPSVAELAHWLKRVGFRQIESLDQSVTTTDEQRATSWMQFESLADFLDPEHPERTIEGYPAPRRALFSATAPQ